MDEKEVDDINGITINIAEDSTYFLREMRTKDKDYKLIKKCFVDQMLKPDTPHLSFDVYKIKIYRVKKRECKEKGKHVNGNLLLFHGTNHESTVGILEKGFKPSTMGMYGRGVYLTERSYTATGYIFVYKK